MAPLKSVRTTVEMRASTVGAGRVPAVESAMSMSDRRDDVMRCFVSLTSLCRLKQPARPGGARCCCCRAEPIASAPSESESDDDGAAAMRLCMFECRRP